MWVQVWLGQRVCVWERFCENVCESVGAWKFVRKVVLREWEAFLTECVRECKCGWDYTKTGQKVFASACESLCERTCGQVWMREWLSCCVWADVCKGLCSNMWKYVRACVPEWERERDRVKVVWENMRVWEKLRASETLSVSVCEQSVRVALSSGIYPTISK